MKSLRQTEEDTLKVLRLAVKGAAEKHRRMGVPMVVWKDGRIAEILPKSIKSHKKSQKKSES
jgi:NCAIR mutase (PurE)-related protein